MDKDLATALELLRNLTDSMDINAKRPGSMLRDDIKLAREFLRKHGKASKRESSGTPFVL